MNIRFLPMEGEQPQRQATFGMSNLRQRTTNLPFTVWISQKDGAQHGARVKVAAGPKVAPSQMGSYAVRPFRHTDGLKLSSYEERCLEFWIELNRDVLMAYWDGSIEYTQDAIEAIKPLHPLP